ncbi:hypothetical protein AVEN_29857-1 [Araneus ventricosus]|uniref:Uncharacterized protein n=1 Tax=Araneus ventricosus TaxID=182803 RepID=A0A4Y2JMT3_ARAVE|nr:hypothetical protein AVEN_29857-1 [Araneus ventricosus]
MQALKKDAYRSKDPRIVPIRREKLDVSVIFLLPNYPVAPSAFRFEKEEIEKKEVLTQRPLLRLGRGTDNRQARPRFARSPKARGRSLDFRHDTGVFIVNARRGLIQGVTLLIGQVTL